MKITCKNSKGALLEIETTSDEIIFANNQGKSHLMVYDASKQEFYMACDKSYVMEAPNKSINFIIPMSNIEGSFGFPTKDDISNVPTATELKGKICGNCLKKKKHIKILSTVGGVTTDELKAKKLKTKLDRMAEPGYYVEYMVNDHGEVKAGSSCSVIYIAKDASVKYVHWEWGSEWNTCTWSGAPTKKKVREAAKIVKAKPGTNKMKYEYYSTWQDFKANCKLPVREAALKKKAPNDI